GWQDRFYVGGEWSTVSQSGYTHSGTQSLHDSPGGNYLGYTINQLELASIIDLRGTAEDTFPRLSFWSRWVVGQAHSLRVEIAREDPADMTQGYNKLSGWTPWEAVPTSYITPQTEKA